MTYTTKKSLLARVRARDVVLWNEFYATYRPLIFLCGRDCGLTHDENEELVQLVMCEIFQQDILGKYNPDKVPPDVTFHHVPAHRRFRHYFKAIEMYAIQKRTVKEVADFLQLSFSSVQQPKTDASLR